MSRIDYHAERVTDYGNITGDGLGNLLGAPKHEPLELLVREAVQNSWDARLTDGTTVEFGVEYKRLSPKEEGFLRTEAMHAHPPQLKKNLSGDLTALMVWDRGTRGLAGPVRPTAEHGDVRDFVNFVYMIGETKASKDHQGTATGGTYGYGRSAFFRASKARCIFVHSRAQTARGVESRFIGIAWVDKYRSPGGLEHTGRHWWGRRRDDWVGPVIGDEADDIARQLGMPLPDRGRTGTTIMVLDPSLRQEDSNRREGVNQDLAGAAVDQVKSSLLWNCWPRMMAGGMDFVVRWDGQEVPLPDPSQHPRLRTFARAFNALREQTEDTPMARRFDIEIYNPSAHLGGLGMARSAFVHTPNGPDPCSPVGDEEPLRHIALMRNTLLVLRYTEAGRVPPRDGEQYAGIFVTNRDVEEVFARSEPPSHDDWVKNRLSDRIERSYVNVAFTRIGEKARDFISPSGGILGGANSRSLAGLADHLGRLLPGLEEDAAGRDTPSLTSGAGSRATKPKVELQPIRRRPGESEVRLEIPFEVQHLDGTRGSRIHFEVSVVTAGGRRETSAPAGRRRPVVEGFSVEGEDWMRPEDGVQHIKFAIKKPQRQARIVVVQPFDCMVNLDVNAEGIREED